MEAGHGYGRMEVSASVWQNRAPCWAVDAYTKDLRNSRDKKETYMAIQISKHWPEATIYWPRGKKQPILIMDLKFE